MGWDLVADVAAEAEVGRHDPLYLFEISQVGKS